MSGLLIHHEMLKIGESAERQIPLRGFWVERGLKGGMKDEGGVHTTPLPKAP